MPSVFEGYGSNGVAVLVETNTGDAERTASELESLFEAHGGNLGDDGCVAWQFERRGVVEIMADEVDDPDGFVLEVIELGGEELREPLPSARVATYRVYCDPTDVGDLDRAMREAGYSVNNAAIVYEPNQRVPLELDAARKFIGFLEALADRPDVQHTYSNWRSA